MHSGLIWRPYTQEKMAAPPIKIARASGSFIYSDDGQKIFDGISSWWLITHGHCHPLIVKAIQRQAAQLDQVTFANFVHEPAENLAARLNAITPTSLNRVFFADNGSTAIEIALKMALQACAQHGFSKKTKFLAFESAYHGDTVGAMSVSGQSSFNRPYRSTLFEILRAKHPTHSASSVEEYVKDFTALIEEHSTMLAGVIIEPLLQGAGGMVVWPDEAVQKIATLCRAHNVYLIFDEVMTGFGRTGKVFAMDRLGVVPDFLCLSKGLTGGSLPLAVTMTTSSVYEAFLAEDKSRMFFHGHSFTGNPISCAAATANLSIFQLSSTLESIERICLQQKKNFDDAKATLPLLDVRLCGTVLAIEFDLPNGSYLSNFSDRVMKSALEQGLFIRPLGSVVYLLPPFCSSEKELEMAWQILKSAVVKHMA